MPASKLQTVDHITVGSNVNEQNHDTFKRFNDYRRLSNTFVSTDEIEILFRLLIFTLSGHYVALCVADWFH